MHRTQDPSSWQVHQAQQYALDSSLQAALIADPKTTCQQVGKDQLRQNVQLLPLVLRVKDIKFGGADECVTKCVTSPGNNKSYNKQSCSDQKKTGSP